MPSPTERHWFERHPVRQARSRKRCANADRKNVGDVCSLLIYSGELYVEMKSCTPNGRNVIRRLCLECAGRLARTGGA